MKTPNIVFVLGGPGCGKGTQCKNIVDHFGYRHLSAGDLLRAERARKGSQFGEVIEGHIRNGTIVPVEITCSLLDKAMQESDFENFLIDGFPRNDNNLTGWNKAMNHKTKLNFVLFIDVSTDVCRQRCLTRGAAGSGRSDDNEESLKKRMKTFADETLPVIQHYDKKGLVKKVNGDKTPEGVFDEIKTLPF